MKTTIDMNDELFKRAKRLAAHEGITFRELIERGVRHELEARNESGFVLADASFGGSGTQPGISEGDWETMSELIYAGRGG